MTIHYSDDQVTLHHGDALDVLRTLPDSSVDAVVTDPPYGLEFMGREWDSFGKGDAQSKAVAGMMRGGHSAADGRPSYFGGLNPKCKACNRSQRGGSPCRCEVPDFTNERLARSNAFGQWCEEWATECLRILKPGGHMLAFGGSRTWHRLAAAVEDAGFEIRDSIAWLYGSGFPKSLDVSKAIDKAAGATREIIGTEPDRWTGKGGVLNFATDRPQAEIPVTGAPATEAAIQWQGWGTALKPAFEPIVVGRKPLVSTVAANVLEHGTGALNIDACRTEGVVPEVPRGKFLSGNNNRETVGRNGEMSEAHPAGRWPTNVVLDESQAAELDRQTGVLTSGSRAAGTYGLMGYMGADDAPMPAIVGDSGGASRFFPTFRYEAKAPTSERPRDGEVAHPTVKPLDLMRWLVRLVTPPGGTVLEPFAGSGTTAEACVIENLRCIAIEREADYLPLIVNRLTKPIQIGFDFEAGGAA